MFHLPVSESEDTKDKHVCIILKVYILIPLIQGANYIGNQISNTACVYIVIAATKVY